MKKFISLVITCFIIFILTGFDKQQNLNIISIKINVKENILRYEVLLKTDDGSPIRSYFDYPGERIQGFELAVLPNKPLAQLMELDDKNSKFTKMRPQTIGTSSLSKNDGLLLFNEYIIKKGSDTNRVEKLARDEATLFIFDGANKIIEQPISRQ
ncbi:hypothetical protein [Bacillus dakarensis]|uniref:hypothetical protein n=1 Tax=Robertmurraya dakarensis TaxID=1926278 RepID=UPI000981AB9D|nr:hypothetical protein [Bacillus dakarensis]